MLSWNPNLETDLVCRQFVSQIVYVSSRALIVMHISMITVERTLSQLISQSFRVDGLQHNDMHTDLNTVGFMNGD